MRDSRTPLAAPTVPPPLDRGEWFAARISLAQRRSARFAKRWSLVFGSLAVVALLLPLASDDPRAADRSRAARLAGDTLRSAQRLRRANTALAAAESLWTDALRRPVPATRVTAAPAVRAPAPTAARPSSEFALTIDEARRLRTVGAWLAVAERPEVSFGPRMRALADTLRALSAERDTLAAGPMRDRELSELTQRIGRTGYTILAIAENRRLELDGRDSIVRTQPDLPAAVPSPVDTPARAVADERPDTAEVGPVLRSARDSVSRARTLHDSLSTVLRTLDSALTATPPSRLAAGTPALALFGVLLVGLLLRFVAALSAEMRAPSLASAREAESLAGVPVLATVRDALLDGPARFRPSGVDPFRMLYLGLTATGTRTRTAIVTGTDPVITAAVGARLAIAAAADHRATLILDLDPAQIALARVLRERAEPGLTDALAGSFRWKEVARPIGSSDGLPITILPSGTERDDFATGEALDRLLEEFAKFRAGFELTILVGPPSAVDLAQKLVGPSPMMLATSTGDTPVERFGAECTALRAEGRRPHGVILWDAERPKLPSRAELAALVSMRKGRTPGGSFEAVRRAIRDRGNQG
jgi:Mrp family chromosome partitioning ATPase